MLKLPRSKGGAACDMQTEQKALGRTEGPRWNSSPCHPFCFLRSHHSILSNKTNLLRCINKQGMVIISEHERLQVSRGFIFSTFEQSQASCFQSFCVSQSPAGFSYTFQQTKRRARVLILSSNSKQKEKSIWSTFLERFL